MNLVFDFGAVVFRWQPAEFLPRLLPHRAADGLDGATMAAAFFQGFGGEWADFDRGSLSADALVARTAARLGWPAADVRRIVEAVPDELQPMVDTVALLARLREAGHRLFFLSNMPAPYADALATRHALLDWFEDGIYSSRVGLIKPEPAIFAAAEARFGVPGAELLFIDDVEKNVLGARRAGWRALLFVGAARLEADLIDAGALPSSPGQASAAPAPVAGAASHASAS